MFSEECPRCSNKLSLNMRKRFIWRDVIPCHYCNGLIEVNENNRQRNSMIIGAFIGTYLTIFHEVSWTFIIVSTLISIFTLQRVVDIFYGLSPYED